MTKLRHPNLVILIGVCYEARALIYEHLPNGSLEDRLIYQDDTPPLSYQTRIRIASEICSALVFIHTNKPRFFIHGDLRLGNILLDANFAAKLGSFGKGTRHITNLEPADFPYIDPHYLTTGELSAKSDVYSFGVVLLQLLTGRVTFNFAREMRDAVNGGNMSYMTALLDPLAGEWPDRSATDLARLALRCCDMDPNNRPDLGTEVWEMLEMLRLSHAEVPSFHHSYTEEDNQVPDGFMCPILQVRLLYSCFISQKTIGKRVVVYSTCCQLGYMIFFALGISGDYCAHLRLSSVQAHRIACICRISCKNRLWLQTAIHTRHRQ